MRQPKLIDYLLLTILSLIWASAFFNIKIATYSFGPVTIAFLRVLFGAIPVLLLCYFKNIKVEAFSKDWHWFAMIGFINLVAPFFLIAYGVKSVQSNLAAILMSTTPLSSTVLAHFYTKNEKFNLIKIKIFIDETLNRFSSIFAAAGHPNAVFEINFENLIALTSGEIKEITE